jgi:deoxycytidine triphosphate deaminase
MFLLNAQMIKALNHEATLLQIAPFEEKCLCPTYYYFRLGKQYRRWATGDPKELRPGNEILRLEPNEYVLIQSYERFRCSKQILGVFGQSSELTRRGLKLVHSPFIDPNFPTEDDPGFLELGLKNELNVPVEIKLRAVIGKVAFYNVADTYPIQDVFGTLSESDYQRRRGNKGPMPLQDDHPVPRDEED